MGSRTTCDCWHSTTYQKWDEWRQMFLPYQKYECWGTKEREICMCGGDQIKCDFYAEIRAKAPKPTITRAEAEKRLRCKIID